jgi:hemerythrin-like domain-containing protein
MISLQSALKGYEFPESAPREQETPCPRATHHFQRYKENSKGERPAWLTDRTSLSRSIVYHRSMLRDQNLVPLSRQHQHALALCVRIDRALQAGEVDLEAWQNEIQQHFNNEILIHFAAEEKELFPAAAKFSQLQSLVAELLDEHKLLRDYFARAAAHRLDRESLRLFATTLSQHIRKEERQLFEQMQQLMTAQLLAALGSALDQSLAAATQACALPDPATHSRPKP